MQMDDEAYVGLRLEGGYEAAESLKAVIDVEASLLLSGDVIYTPTL